MKARQDLIAASKELTRCGTAHATGNALRLMYANLLAFEKRLSVTTKSMSWPIPELFDELTGANDEEIRFNYLKLRKEL